MNQHQIPKAISLHNRLCFFIHQITEFSLSLPKKLRPEFEFHHVFVASLHKVWWKRAFKN